MNAKVEELKVLDHGYVRLIECWGTGIEGVDHGLHETYPSDYEVAIIEAARMSTNKGFEGWEKDAKLHKFLYENKHFTPFEMSGMTIEVAAPIACFREWHRHRTQSFNEMSGRYIQLPNENYVPAYDNLMQRIIRGLSTGNKQEAGLQKEVPTPYQVSTWLARLQHAYDVAQEVYQDGLDIGIPKEIARMPIGVGRYSRMRASANLRNWLQFLTLRMDPKAQWEIRQFASAVGTIIAAYFPRTWGLFDVPV